MTCNSGTRSKFGFYKLLSEIFKRNSGFEYFGFEFGVMFFLPSTSELHHSCITELRQTGDDASATHQ